MKSKRKQYKQNLIWLSLILEDWKHGDPLPKELHPSIIRDPLQVFGNKWLQSKGMMSFIKGLYHEELLCWLLEQAMQDSDENGWLQKVVNPRQYGIRDQLGIDITLHTCYGKIQVQVKSSEFNRRQFLCKRAQKNEKPIPCVVVRSEMDDREILKNFAKEVKPYLLEKKLKKESWDAMRQTHAS